MGLCKCRTVTTLFCFEHRKNVCEKCVLSEHETVPLRKWHENNLYSASLKVIYNGSKTVTLIPIAISATNLFTWKTKKPSDSSVSVPRVNLIILSEWQNLDLFHLSCLLRYCQISGDGEEIIKVKCPLCNGPVIPSESVSTPLADSVRVGFNQTQWSNIIALQIVPLRCHSLAN